MSKAEELLNSILDSLHKDEIKDYRIELIEKAFNENHQSRVNAISDEMREKYQGKVIQMAIVEDFENKLLKQ